MNTLESNFSCPCCGSSNVEKVVENSNIPVPYAAPAQFKSEQLVCKDCGMNTDISESKDMQNAIDKVTQESVSDMINSLTSFGWTLAKIEHSLALPERTLSRWIQNPKLSKESIALLRILKTYPWIVLVADRQYEAGYAQGQVVIAAGQIICMGGLIGIGLVQFTPVIGGNAITMIGAIIETPGNAWAGSPTVRSFPEPVATLS